MSSIEEVQWEALPARKRKTGSAAQLTPVVRKQVAGHQQILDNIAARKQQHNSDISTLLSQDGCAGAFYEYLDHTADVQCHAWGADMKAAFENMAPCMLNYMTDLALISANDTETVQLEVTGHDLQSLLYNYMNELLFMFSTDSFVTVQSKITEFDREHWSIKATLLSEVNDHSLQITEELCTLCQFPSVDKVLTVLLQRYGIVDFRQLQCGEYMGVPSLALLAQINCKVDSFLAATFATSSIVSLWDLDVQCAEYLSSFNIPPLRPVLPTSIAAPTLLSSGDPNEVDLDIECSDTCNTAMPEAPPADIHSFESYGVGKLLYHPLVWRYFARITQYESSNKEYLRSEDVLQYLLDYQTHKKSQQSGHNRKFNDFNVQEFISYVCTALEITDLIEVGVVIQGNLQAERVALEHVVNNRYKLFVEITKRELSQFNQQMQSYQEDGRRTAKKRRKRDTTEETVTATEVEQKEVGGEDEARDQVQDETEEVGEVAAVADVDGNSKGAGASVDVVAGADSAGADSESQSQSAMLQPDGPAAAAATSTTAATTAAVPVANSVADAAHSSSLKCTHSCTDTKLVLTQPFESSLTVYLPTGQPSVTHISAAHQDHSTLDACNSGIYVIENWELQPVLPFVSAAMANMTANTCNTVSSTSIKAPPPPPNHAQSASGVYVSTIHNTIGSNSNGTSSIQNSNVNVMDSQAVGRWGEALVYQYLLHSSPVGSVLNWLNQDEESRACYDIILHAPSGSLVNAARASRAHHNNAHSTQLQQGQNGASGASQCSAGLTSSSLISPPPITVESSGRHSTEYIEVKSTRYNNRNVFEISPNEWQFAAADSRVPYHIFRVFSAGDVNNVKIVVIRDILSRITEGRVKICLAI